MRKVSRALLLALALAPLFLAANGYLRAGTAQSSFVWLTSLTVLSLGVSFLPGKIRVVGTVAASVLLAGLNLSDPLFAILLLLLLPVSAHAVTTGKGLMEGPRPLVAGAALYAAAGILFYFTKRADDSALNGYLALAFLGAGAIFLNRQSMLYGAIAQGGKKRAPYQLARGNRLLTVLIVAAVAATACFDNLKRGANWLLKEILKIIYRAIAFLVSLLPAPSAAPSATGSVSKVEIDPADAPSGFWAILEKIMVVIAWIAAAALVFFALRALIKWLRRAIARLSARMKSLISSMGEDYSDARESLINLSDLREEARGRVKKLLSREPGYHKLNGAERARYIVRILYKRAGDAIPDLSSRTLREAAPDLNAGNADKEALCALYERVRYAGENPPVEEVDAVRRAVDA